ncbi:MAG: hypothetical protein COA96_12855 [SAR86 cluster bacterium]|uniref:Uncharacterized protein n=1 Tax=SAR86 cluster bacterium TaxID=2030880 RepID=A0A2A5AW40_9GAMM|nr:MAG: hypothetical protein COA96_12855 [SAR86 cluster bacterium]
MNFLYYFCRYRGIFLVLGSVLSACSQMPVVQQEPEEPLPLVGSVVLHRADEIPTQDRLLEVGVLIFDAQDNSQGKYQLGDWVFDEIIQKETRFLPHLLASTLMESNQWGAIRVIPETDPSLDLFVQGTIIKSDGLNLVLEIQAKDSTGREWLNKIYADEAGFSDYPESTRFTLDDSFDARNYTDPFQDIYNQIANDLLAVRADASDQSIANINSVTDMTYASDLSPETFAHTLTEGLDGYLTVSSLLARNDPMLSRVADMLYRHHLFIDTVDEYYTTLYDDVKPAYVLWRRYSIDEIIETETNKQQAQTNDYGNSSRFLSLSQRYDRFKWSKIFEREFIDLASGFNTELAPAMLELNNEVHGLTGTMEQQYREWRGILKALFELETAQAEN